MVVMMSDSCKCKQDGVDGATLNTALAGCFRSKSTAAVASSNGAIVSSPAASWVAPRMSPSASILETLVIRLLDDDDGWTFGGFCCCGAGDTAGILVMGLFILDARLFK